MTVGQTVFTLSLPEGSLVLKAVILDATHIRCGLIFVVDPHPIAALCRALVVSGQVDAPVQIRAADRSPCCFVLSFTETDRRSHRPA